MLKPITLGAFAVLTSVSPARTQQLPPIRQLGSVVATSKETFGPNVFVRHLKGGVLVNDVQNRRLLLFDSTLASFTVVADTTPATASAYSGRVGGLIAYRADSSLFVDPASQSMLVIDPAGKVQRVMAVPRSQDAMMLGNPMIGTPGLDATGRLVYRGFPRMQMMRPPGGGEGNRGFTPPEMPESTAIVRIDLTSRQTDTVGFAKIPKMKMDMQRDDNGRVTVNMVMNPLPVVDEWAVLSDGSIALVRGRDYHVDWVRPDGARESSPKIPFEWQRLTDEDKIAFIDSVKAARQRMAASAPTPATPGAAAGGGGGAVAGGGGEQRLQINVGPGGGPPPGGGPGGGGGPNVSFVQPSDLPDYKPPFFAGAGSVRADADNHLWIRTIPTKGIAGGPVYDVINTKGELVERVQVPKDRVIVGFGAGGVVYLVARDGTTTKLERARVK
ncbi:MAG TPA: hypothetical protein VIF32_10860 [Gemmatimonadaceae bacterium]|jgi:hypothetical protein